MAASFCTVQSLRAWGVLSVKTNALTHGLWRMTRVNRRLSIGRKARHKKVFAQRYARQPENQGVEAARMLRQ